MFCYIWNKSRPALRGGAPKIQGAQMSLVENTPKVHPQKYQNEDEPVPMLALVPIHLRTGTFGVDVTYGWALGTGLTPNGT